MREARGLLLLSLVDGWVPCCGGWWVQREVPLALVSVWRAGGRAGRRLRRIDMAGCDLADGDDEDEEGGSNSRPGEEEEGRGRHWSPHPSVDEEEAVADRCLAGVVREWCAVVVPERAGRRVVPRAAGPGAERHRTWTQALRTSRTGQTIPPPLEEGRRAGRTS